jgi:cobalt-zinc-cadmium efflux system outer membrane protein
MFSFGCALGEFFTCDRMLAQGKILMMRARLFMLAPGLVILTMMTARGDDQSASDRSDQSGRQPAAVSTFGGVRRSGNAPQVEPGSSVGTGTGTSQARKNGPSTATAALTPSSREKKPARDGAPRRAAIPPPRHWPTTGERQNRASSDTSVSRAQGQPGGMDLQINPLPGANASSGVPRAPLLNSGLVGGQPIAMQAALYGAVTSNPDLVTMREGNAIAASAEAVEVARHFPTTLNPTLWIDYRPITLVPNGTFGTGPSHASASGNNFYHYGQDYIYVSLRQPVELGHQTRYRYHIAQAAYDQQKWLVVQAELTALVQTYRFFQTAAYRREKFRLAQELADFNDRLQETLQRRMEANQVQAADVSLARVESRATRQQVKAAKQDYLIALTDMRNQIGIPEQAGTFEPLGEFSVPPYIPPVDEQVMVQEAIHNRPDIQAARAQVAGTHSAVNLAKGDRIPTPIIGPEYQMDEAGVQYVGFVFIAPIPIWNNGKPLVLQREAEHRRALVAFKEAEQRAVGQVRAAVAKWNGATELVNDSVGLSNDLSVEVQKMERLFEEGQADLTKLMQARQRLIQLENSRLDAVWQATQAQADLLLALGVPSLINDMINRSEHDAVSGASPRSTSAPGPRMPSAPKP